jgi:peptidyl-prolyl cis-trans isomerase D
MLKTLRQKRVAKKIFIVLAVIIIPAFVLWGSGSILRSRRNQRYAGMLFGKIVNFDQYNSSLIACKNQAIIRFGDNFYDIQKFLNFNEMAWDRLIQLHEARRRKIKVNNSEVIKRIASLPFFQKDGKFDSKNYKYLLDYVFRTPARQFEEEIRESLMIEKLFDEVTKSVSVTEEEILNGYKKENEKVKVSYIQILPDSFISKVTLDDKEISGYYQKHKDEFKKPPTVNIEYFGIDYPENASDSDKSKILDRMKEISQKIRRPEDFQRVSHVEGLPIKETGFFSLKGPVEGFGWSFEFIQSSFALKDNQISKPIPIRKGCYILKLKERKESYIPRLKEVKDEISKILKQNKAKELAKTKAQEYLTGLLEIYRKNPNNIDFEKLAKKWGGKSNSTALFSRQDYIPNIGQSMAFKDVAFNLRNKKEPFDIVTIETGTFIIKLDKYIPIDEEKFKTEREDFKKRLLQSKKNEYFNKFMDQVRNSAHLVDNISTAPLENP